MEAVKQSLNIPFRVDGPPLVYEFDNLPLINEEGEYLDEQPVQKRKRADHDEEDGNRKRRQSAGAKGSARNVSSCKQGRKNLVIWIQNHAKKGSVHSLSSLL